MAGIAALVVAYVFSQFYRVFLAVLAPELSAELGADAADLGRASGAWFLAFGVMQLPVGLMLDRIGPSRTAAGLFLVGAAGGAGLFALAQTPLHVILAMGLIGVGCAPILMASFYVFARRFPPAAFATLSSMMLGLGALGNIAGASPLALAVEAFGWRGSLTGLALASALSAVAVWALLRDPPPPEPVPGAPADRGFMDYFALLKLPVLWPIMAMVFVNYAAVGGVRGLWAGPWLAETYGMDAAAIGRATLWMALAMAVGAFAYGPLDRVFGTRKWVVFGGNCVALAICAALAAAPAAGPGISVALITALGAFGLTYAVVFAHARAFLPAHQIGRGVGLMNFFSIGGVGVFQVLGGELAARIDGPAGWSAVFAMYAIALVVALTIYLFSRDSKP